MATGPLLARTLGELRQLERELIERRLLRHDVGQQRIEEVVRKLAEVGSPGGLLTRAASELGRSCGFDRVLISRLGEDGLHPQSLWSSDDQGNAAALLEKLGSGPLALRYPLVEAEVAKHREAQLVALPAGGLRAQPEFAAALGWDAYVVAPIVLERRAAGLLHADRIRPGDPVELDLELVELCADGLGRAFERTALRHKLQRQGRQLELAGQWINGQIRQLSTEDQIVHGRDDLDLTEVLTKRELEVLVLIAKGMSNRAIAARLVLGEGTVKYHVKNVLRKLNARSRAEAVSAYMTMSKPPRRP